MSETDGLLIWWITHDECEAIMGDARSPILVTRGWPQYLADQFQSRLGRAGRKRLWVDDQFGDVAIDPWPVAPDAPGAMGIASDSGGIVFRCEDLSLVRKYPGYVTDFRLYPA